MANPTKNKYGVYMYTVRVPSDLVHVVGRKVYAISLQTKDPKTARERFNAMVAQKDREHATLRGAPEALPFASLVALAGEVYREQRAFAEAAAGPGELEMIEEALAARAEDRRWLADIADAKLLERGLSGDQRSRELLADAVAGAFAGLSREVAKMRHGDFSPDQNLTKFAAAAATKPTKGTAITTGARVAEITQLRKEDVQQVDGIPFIRITPEAGSVKTGQYRHVPLHPHLVEMGFLDFVRSSPEGPLFYEPTAKRKGKGITQAQWAGNELGRWLKTELKEAWPDVQPNHAWRHRFKTQGRLHGIGSEFIDAVQGHSNKTVAASYGEMPLKALYREIKKLPRVMVG